MDFSPVNFALRQIKIDGLADSRGRFIMSIVAALQTDDEAETVASKVREDENCVLEWLRRQPGISLSGIATKVGWNTPKGLPNKRLVQRLLTSLKKDKLVATHRNKWVLTEAGKGEMESE